MYRKKFVKNYTSLLRPSARRTALDSDEDGGNNNGEVRAGIPGGRRAAASRGGFPPAAGRRNNATRLMGAWDGKSARQVAGRIARISTHAARKPRRIGSTPGRKSPCVGRGAATRRVTKDDKRTMRPRQSHQDKLHSLRRVTCRQNRPRRPRNKSDKKRTI